jgi:hypothetical protein
LSDAASANASCRRGTTTKLKGLNKHKETGKTQCVLKALCLYIFQKKTQGYGKNAMRVENTLTTLFLCIFHNLRLWRLDYPNALNPKPLKTLCLCTFL